jgi:hypothetical protein
LEASINETGDGTLSRTSAFTSLKLDGPFHQFPPDHVALRHTAMFRTLGTLGIDGALRDGWTHHTILRPKGTRMLFSGRSEEQLAR